MIAFAGAMRLKKYALGANIHAPSRAYAFSVKPRWDLAELQKP
jgi:hypothetical protein